MRNIILEMFQWKLTDITEHLSEISEAGYNMIQISPLQPTKDNGSEWWKLYQPIDFTIGNTQIGTKKDLINLCRAAHKYDIKVIADIVINHVASEENDSLTPHRNVSKLLTENSSFWKSKQVIRNWDDRHEVVTYSNGLPCLNLNNLELQDIIISFMNDYVTCGIDGFRIDSAKSIALPSEGCGFWSRVMGEFENLFNYGEVIFSPKNIVDEYCNYCYVTTSSEASDDNKIVRYVENHDTYLDDIIGYTKRYNDETIIKAWENLYNNHQNILFYTRPFNDLWKDKRITRINNR